MYFLSYIRFLKIINLFIMKFKILDNGLNLYYDPKIKQDLVLVIDNPYYIILFLLIELHISHLNINYNSKFCFELETNDLILETLSVVLNTLLDYYELDNDLYISIIKNTKKSSIFNLLKLMYPNYENLMDYNDKFFFVVNKSIKYNLINQDIHILTSNRKIFDNCNYFNRITKFNKKKLELNQYILPFKKLDYEYNYSNFVGVYLNQLKYYDFYILDLLIHILNKNAVIDEHIQIVDISKKSKVLVFFYFSIIQFKKIIEKINNGIFDLKFEIDNILENKSLLDLINYKKFDINIYFQIKKDEIINLSKKIFNKKNIKYIGNYK